MVPPSIPRTPELRTENGTNVQLSPKFIGVILLQKNIRRYNIPMAQFLTLAQTKKKL